MSSLTHQKIYTKVQNNISKCIRQNDLQSISDIFDSKISESVKCCIESSIRNFVVQTLCKDDNADLNKIKALVTLCIEAVRKELALPTLPVLVLSDALESLTLVQCEKLFEFVESNVAVWKEEQFFGPCKNYVLRMCNDVLRRLSRSQNTVFCGRILLLLARFFPFSERSGLNLISEFNLENVTSFTNAEATDENTENTKKPENENDKSTLIYDYTFYTKFWALQDFFRNPPQCFQKSPWKLFSVYADDVLEAFTNNILQDEVSGNKSAVDSSVSANNNKKKGGSPADLKCEQYFPKYLTNQKLLELQFSDVNFRRYVLLQLLILFQYLTANVKFKQESLSDEQLRWVKNTEEKVYELLALTPPDGVAFVKSVKHTLKREDKWNEWKNNGCPEIKKPVANIKEAVDNGETESEGTDKKKAKRQKLKRPLGDVVRDADSKRKFTMGNQEMTRLWNLSTDNLDSCRAKRRDFVPSLEDYFTPAIEQMAQSKLETSDKKVNDSNFGWRGLRLLACRSPHFFTHSTTVIATLPEYLTNMVKKIAKDMPTSIKEDEAAPAEDDDDKEMKMDADGEREGGMDEDGGAGQEDDNNERQELHAITDAEQKELAFNLAELGSEKWKVLAKKLGFENDEIEYINQEKTSVEERAAYAFQLWVENEGNEANKAALLYTLEGLGLSSIAEGVFS